MYISIYIYICVEPHLVLEPLENVPPADLVLEAPFLVNPILDFEKDFLERTLLVVVGGSLSHSRALGFGLQLVDNLVRAKWSKTMNA